MKDVTLGLFLAVGAWFACGCTGSGKQSSSGDATLAGALTRGVKFDKAILTVGKLPKANAKGDKARLLADAAVQQLKPGKASIMALDVDNPDEDGDPVVATLMQFANSDSTIEVPAKGNKSPAHADAGAAGVHIENGFSVASDICKLLCKRKFTTHITLTVRLEQGGVCAHEERELELDCSKDGDPKRCDGDEPNPDAGHRDAGAGKDSGSAAGAAGARAGSSGAGSGGRSGASGAGTSGGSGADNAGAGGQSGQAGAGAGNPPQIGLLSPASVASSAPVSLSISGGGFGAGAVAYFDAEPVTTTFVSASELTAMIPAARTANPGSHVVYVENTPGDATSRSNTLYLRVDPPAGAPVIYDYSPDNGVAGDKILIIASQLANQTLIIKDSAGHSLAPGALSTIAWPGASSPDTVEVTLPAGVTTGPITVANSVGSFSGKIFTVGSNLTRLAGTTLESATEYNETNWSRASGGDNLLSTSYFAKHGDCASMTSCTTVPYFKIVLPSAQTVGRIAMRGNREYMAGYDFLRVKFELLDAANAAVWEGTYDLPEPDRDLDVSLPAPVTNVVAVKFTSLVDESDEPGFSELEVFEK